MRRILRSLACVALLVLSCNVYAAERVVDIPTRSGVTQRFLFLPATDAKAAVILFAGGHGGLQFDTSGRPRTLRNNFLVRSRELFAAQSLTVAVIDAPSDRQSEPFLNGFRQTPEHAADVQAVIAWLKAQTQVPVWLVGTSRGTQSAAAVAVTLSSGGGPDGIVLTSTILVDRRGRPVPDIAVDTLKIPVLVVHHEQDGCRSCLYGDVPLLMRKLAPVPKKELVTFRGGENHGDPCEALAYHGYNGIERDVVARIAAWITK
ncbi:MAG TPA: alpha/beta hydrolase [Burkholderiales bacterium]|nr:alpha/beta hydrolase [Burkholderiales bacterium]